MGRSYVYRGKGPPPRWEGAVSIREEKDHTLLVVGGLALLALALFGGLGSGFGTGQAPGGGGGPGSGEPGGGGGKPPLELLAAGIHIHTRAGLNVWGPLGSGFGWLADANTILAGVEDIQLYSAKGSQDMIEAFKEWMLKNRPDIELGEIDDLA